MTIIMLVFIIIFFSAIVSASDAQDLEPAGSEVAVNVVFTDSKKEPRSKDTVLFKNVRTQEVFSGITDSLGKVTLYLTKGDTFINGIIVREGDTVDYGQVTIPNLQKLLSVDLAREYEYQQRTFILENVLFDTDKASLKKESYQALEELYQSLVFSPGMEIEIGGHTDNSGTPEHNLKLSQARAESVKNYLVKKGVAFSRVRAKGYGQSIPIADNTSEEGRRLNRRTEVRIIKE